jgi:hypothetical protein
VYLLRSSGWCAIHDFNFHIHRGENEDDCKIHYDYSNEKAHDTGQV